jgi:hypothetical protein
MAQYMYQVSFTAEAWSKMVKEPQNREAAIRPVIEKLGGKLLGYWSVAAASLAATAGGAVKSLKTTVLMSVEDAMQAMKTAQGAGFRPPS